eukprot:gene11059-14844_t
MTSRLVVITGASRGFGRSIALTIAQVFQNDHLHFILTSRSQVELNETKSIIFKIRENIQHGVSTVCDIFPVDLSDLSSLPIALSDVFNGLSDSGIKSPYTELMFFNNAGSLGPLNLIGVQNDILSDMSTAFNLNVTSSCYITSDIVRRLDAKLFPSTITKATIVNISSLCAIQPFESWSIYCAGKAARDMYHKTLAKEKDKLINIDNNQLIKYRIMNYAPGPLDTDMQKQIREGENVDKDQQTFFKQLKENNQLVDLNESSNKLIQLLIADTYENGAHVDFFD